MADTTTPLRYPCPLGPCTWAYEVGALHPDGSRLHPGMSDVDQAIREHAATHTTDEWFDEVADLQARLAAADQPPPIQWCTHCVVEHKQAAASGPELPPLFPGVLLATTMGPNGVNVALFCEVRHHLNVTPPKLLLAQAGSIPNGRPLG